MFCPGGDELSYIIWTDMHSYTEKPVTPRLCQSFLPSKRTRPSLPFTLSIRTGGWEGTHWSPRWASPGSLPRGGEPGISSIQTESPSHALSCTQSGLRVRAATSGPVLLVGETRGGKSCRTSTSGNPVSASTTCSGRNSHWGDTEEGRTLGRSPFQDSDVAPHPPLL